MEEKVVSEDISKPMEMEADEGRYYIEFFNFLLENQDAFHSWNAFPVGKIDKLPVRIVTGLDNKGILVILIMKKHKDNSPPLYRKKIWNYCDLKKFITNIRNIKFNNELGVFPDKDIIKHGETFVCDNIELLTEECSVCYEKTETKTKCGHSLCIRCETELFIKRKASCPICRSCLVGLHAEATDDEEEED